MVKVLNTISDDVLALSAGHFDHLPYEESSLPDIPYLFSNGRAEGLDITSAYWDKDQWEKYLNDLEALKDQKPDRELSPADKIGVVLAQANRLGDIAAFRNPYTGRPDVMANKYFMSALGKLKTYAAKKLDQTWDQVENMGKNLEGLYYLYFEQKRANGEASVGWLSDAEKQSFLDMLDTFGTEAAKPRLRGMLTANMGEAFDETRFEDAWKKWLEGVVEWRPRFEAQIAPEEPIAIGEEATRSFMETWGMKIDVDTLIAKAKSDKEDIQAEIDRLKMAGVTHEAAPSFDKDEDLIAHVRTLLHKWKKVIGDKLPNAANIDLDKIEITTVAPKPGAAIAVCQYGNIKLLSCEGEGRAIWEGRWQGLERLIFHETTHSYQQEWSDETAQMIQTPFGKETGAKVVEWMRLLLMEELPPHVILTQLETALRETQMAISALEFHAEREGADDLEEALMSAGINGAYAKQMLPAIQTDPWYMAQYWFAARLFADMIGRDCKGDIQTGFEKLAAEVDLTTPAHVVSASFVPNEQYSFSSTPHPVVQISRNTVVEST